VLDIPLFTTRRRTSSAGGMVAAPAYKIPLLDGWYLVYLIMGDRPYGNEDFTVYFEPGEAGSLVVPNVRPEVMAGGEYKVGCFFFFFFFLLYFDCSFSSRPLSWHDSFMLREIS
jgi:hypothetical protein